jgi:hypothetical protein
MIRNTTFVLLAVVGWSFFGLGQEKPDTLRFAGSPILGWVFLDLASLNAVLKAQGHPTTADNFFVWGGRNTILPQGVLGRWSFDFSNWYGDATAHQGDKLSRLTFVWGGAVAEHPLAGFMRGSELSGGLAVGVGVTTLTLLAHRSQSFEDALSRPASVFLSRWYFSVQPQLCLNIPLFTIKEKDLRTVSLKLSIGYMLTFDNGAWDQEGRALKGPPDRFNGWNIQLTLGL